MTFQTSMNHRKLMGFTLIEMLMVLVLVAIMATLAGPSFSNLMAKNRVKSTSSNLHISLLKARSEAVKRNANVTVSPTTGTDWKSGWQVLDADGNDLFNIEAPETDIDASSNADIVYTSSGRIQGSARTFTIEDNNVTLDDDDKRCVSINLSGMPATRKGAC